MDLPEQVLLDFSNLGINPTPACAKSIIEYKSPPPSLLPILFLLRQSQLNAWPSRHFFFYLFLPLLPFLTIYCSNMYRTDAAPRVARLKLFITSCGLNPTDYTSGGSNLFTAALINDSLRELVFSELFVDYVASTAISLPLKPTETLIDKKRFVAMEALTVKVQGTIHSVFGSISKDLTRYLFTNNEFCVHMDHRYKANRPAIWYIHPDVFDFASAQCTHLNEDLTLIDDLGYDIITFRLQFFSNLVLPVIPKLPQGFVTPSHLVRLLLEFTLAEVQGAFANQTIPDLDKDKVTELLNSAVVSSDKIFVPLAKEYFTAARFSTEEKNTLGQALLFRAVNTESDFVATVDYLVGEMKMNTAHLYPEGPNSTVTLLHKVRNGHTAKYLMNHMPLKTTNLLNHQDQWGNTPLFYFIERFSDISTGRRSWLRHDYSPLEEFIELCVEMNYDFNATNKFGQSPLLKVKSTSNRTPLAALNKKVDHILKTVEEKGGAVPTSPFPKSKPAPLSRRQKRELFMQLFEQLGDEVAATKALQAQLEQLRDGLAQLQRKAADDDTDDDEGGGMAALTSDEVENSSDDMMY